MRLQILQLYSLVSYRFFTIFDHLFTLICLDKEDSVPNLESDQPIIVAMNGVAWELIRYTVDGHSGNCNQGDDSRGIAYLGIQRRRSSGRIDHICDVSFSVDNGL